MIWQSLKWSDGAGVRHRMPASTRQNVGASLVKIVVICEIAVLCLSLCGGIASAEDFAGVLPRIEPTEPKHTLDGFNVAEGFAIQLIASEPLVNSPVAAEWSASGELFVCEMRGYSEERDAGLSRVSRLVDEDNDGVYDSSKVFADGLLWPTAIFPYRGGLFVGDAPDLWYMKDNNGDGVADEKRVVLTGFSTSNVQGLLNSFRWGLDNRIHLAVGTAGGNVRRPDQDVSESVSVRGFDLAFDPDTFQFERTSGGAQHGMCFDDWGRKFVCSNSDHLQQVMYDDRDLDRKITYPVPSARLSIAADGPQAEVFRISPVEPWRVLRTKLRVAGIVGGPVEGGGRAAGYFTGATGVTIYRGDAWPDSDGPIAIIGDVGSNLIHRKRLVRQGLEFLGRRIDENAEFVASIDNWFRPAQFSCGPDGALTVIDVYREVIEHPKSLPPDIKRHLDLNAGRDRGRLYRVVPQGFVHRPTANLANASTDALVSYLDHDNAWHRETAARLIYERQDPAAERWLRELLKHGAARGRMHAMYALDGIGKLRHEDVITGLADRHDQVVCHAIRLATRYGARVDVIESLKPLVNHPSIDVRCQLAFSMSKFATDQSASWLASILARNISNRWIQLAVMSSIGDQAERLLFETLAMFESHELNRDAVAFIATLVESVQGSMDGQAARRLAELLLEKGSDGIALPMFHEFCRGRWRVLVGDDWVAKIEARQQQLVDQAIDRYADNDASDQSRIDALMQLGPIVDQRLDLAAMDVLANHQSMSLVSATLRAMNSRASRSVVNVVLDRMKQWSPQIRNTACELLFSSPAQAQLVFQAIDEGHIAAEDFPMMQWKLLSENSDGSIADRAKGIVASVKSPSRQSVLDEYQDALKLVGDASRGAVVFRDQCASCHRVGDIGHEVGPSLMAAATRGADSILVNVLDPNREVNPQYRNYVVLTDEGQTFSGMIVGENSNSITLRAAESLEQSVSRDQIEWIRDTGVSIMPEGLEKVISTQQMADLIEYLRTAH
ncbi:c-type cytochrome [Stieleria sp. JC731]|uniref:PVC-type heme-binding CxxCH protein n=1 Tax=Pirellulaceae TaxID=2691357 RepID=UPI001E520817|nr:PVC-type heme-binding CxxCH protein [Stieleria sp. JC731]MCC9599614.1 c-type cytochrome [Stieleria sp. JC731]